MESRLTRGRKNNADATRMGPTLLKLINENNAL
jgi:hypothetical protein